MSLALLWIPSTIAAAAAQTARNAMQHQLTAEIGTLGATQVRFLYGFPFALVFLAAISLAGGSLPPTPNSKFLAYIAWGALTQILATALMLAAMREKSFALTITYIKTEALQVALFGFLFLRDPLTSGSLLAILTTTIGVIAMTWKPAARQSLMDWRPMLLGIGSGAMFALSSVGYRGSILALESGSFLMRASTSVTWALALQSLLLLVWLGLFQREALVGSLRVWRYSLFAGFMGALASQFWFLGFALTTAANVRTLGLVEVLFAQIVSRRLAQRSTGQERIGMALVVLGVLCLLWFAQ